MSCDMLGVLTRGGNAYLEMNGLATWDTSVRGVLRGNMAYQDQNAMKKPRYEKKNTRPYLLTGLKMGIDLAFLL